MGLPIAAPLMAYMYPLIDTIDGNPNILSTFNLCIILFAYASQSKTIICTSLESKSENT
jgi:hypothetical protein